MIDVWVMHPAGGFYSAVEDKKDHNTLVVRARCREDLVRLNALLPGTHKIVDNEGTDYPFRIRLSREEWAVALVQMGQRIDYTNFKDEVKAKQGKRRADVYSRIWGALLSLEPKRLRSRYDQFPDLEPWQP